MSIPLITWVTLTEMQFLNGPWVSGMEISSSLGLKKTLKLVRGKENFRTRNSAHSEILYCLTKIHKTDYGGYEICHFAMRYPVRL